MGPRLREDPHLTAPLRDMVPTLIFTPSWRVPTRAVPTCRLATTPASMDQVVRDPTHLLMISTGAVPTCPAHQLTAVLHHPQRMADTMDMDQALITLLNHHHHNQPPHQLGPTI